MTPENVPEILHQVMEDWLANPREIFVNVGQESFTWYGSAMQLRRGATLLEPEMRQNYDWYLESLHADPASFRPYQAPVYGPYVLLAGLSLELLAKAILIERDPNLVSNSGLESWGKGSGHELPLLLKKVGVNLDEEETYLAERLGESVVWAGRYPIPRRAESFAPRLTPQGELASPGDFRPETDPSRIEAIWERLKSILFGEWWQRHPETALASRVIETGDLSLLTQGQSLVQLREQAEADVQRAQDARTAAGE
jgi:hypothetical protein